MIAGGRQTSNGENRDRNGHVLVWEQPGLDENDRRLGKHRGIFTQFIMLFYLIILSLFINFSKMFFIIQ